MTTTIKTPTLDLQAKHKHRREQLADQARVQGISPAPRNDLLPGLAVIRRPLDSLKVPGRNVRNDDPVQTERVTNSLKAFGFVQPILIHDDGTIVDGAARWRAAKTLGLGEAPCIVIDHLKPDELRLLRITLNRTAELGGWSIPDLQLEFQELDLGDLSLEITGFSLPEIDGVLLDDTPQAAALDETSKPAEVAVTKLGDVWRLGQHRLVCGDSRNPATYQALMGDDQAQLVLTDPPYNVPIDGHVSSSGHREFACASGEMTPEQFLDFNKAWMEQASAVLVKGGLFGAFIDWRGQASIQVAGKSLGLELQNLIVWTKTNAGMGSLYRSQHELMPLFKKPGAAHINNVELGKHGRWRSNVWVYPGANSLGSQARGNLADHPTVKPTAMIQDALLDLTNAGDVVLDPFLGSGTTLIAAEAAGRRCRGVEIDPIYADLIIRRWAAMTGKPAVLEETGQGFDEVAAERGKPLEPVEPVEPVEPEA